MLPSTLGMIMLLALATSCGKTEKKKRALRDRVVDYCRDLSVELDVAAEKYAQLAPIFDGTQQVTTSERQLAESTMQSDSIGVTPDMRYERLRGFGARFTFCLNVRQLDETATAGIRERFRRLEFTLRNQALPDARRQGHTHAEAAKVLDELAALAREVDKLLLLE